MTPTAIRAVIHSRVLLAGAASRGSCVLSLRQSYGTTGTADPKIHAGDNDPPQDHEGAEMVKGAEATELHQQRLQRKGGVQEVEPPSTVNTQTPGKPFASSLRLESSEVGDGPDPTGQQKRPL